MWLDFYLLTLRKLLQQTLGMPQKKKAPKNSRRRRGAPSPKIKEEMAVLNIDKEMVSRYLNINYSRTVPELKRLAKSPNISAGERQIINIMLKIESLGDVWSWNQLMNRMIGPITQKVSITRERSYENWSMEELMAEKERLDKDNRETINSIHKERKLIAMVHSGEILVGQYTRLNPVTGKPEEETRDDSTDKAKSGTDT